MNPKLKNIVVKELATTKLRLTAVNRRPFLLQKKQMEFVSKQKKVSSNCSYSKPQLAVRRKKQASVFSKLNVNTRVLKAKNTTS